MTLQQFIQKNALRPADAIIVKKLPFGLLDHYLIFLGYHGNQPIFIANYTKGIRILRTPEILEFALDFVPSHIRRFKGNEVQRNAAVRRALSRQDENSYHLLLNNCEHYANYVQKGNAYSSQTKTFGTGLVVTGLIASAASKDSKVQGAGLFAAALGLLTLLMDEK